MAAAAASECNGCDECGVIYEGRSLAPDLSELPYGRTVFAWTGDAWLCRECYRKAQYRPARKTVSTESSDGSDRYRHKRALGLSDKRFDGTKYNPETDRQAFAAEVFAAGIFGQKANNKLLAGGDGGTDFMLCGRRVEVYHLGIGKDGRPRTSGHLIMNPEEPQRFAGLYLVVRGSIEEGFEIAGWTSHQALVSEPQQDFGYGKRYAMPVRKLLSLALLREKVEEYCKAGDHDSTA